MKSFCLLLSNIILVTTICHAQNVGVGTITPSYKLHVDNGSLDTTYMGITTRTTGTNLGDGLLLGVAGKSAIIANLENGNLRLGTNNLSRIIIDSTGNVGLGTFTPVTKLDVNGGLRVAGFNSIELGGGVAGKEINAGKIGYRTFTTDALDIVGAGASTTDRKVKLYAEGGTTLTGPLNIAGAMQVYGNSGTAGQVLTSTGTGAPEWTTGAYGNSTRFGLYFSGASASGSLTPQITLYNTNTDDVTVGSSYFTINHSGLYHFNGSINGIIQTSTAFGVTPQFSMNMTFTPPSVGGTAFYLTEGKEMKYNPGQSSRLYSDYEIFNQDFYIIAPCTISIRNLFYYTGSPTATFLSYMNLFGYRISD